MWYVKIEVLVLRCTKLMASIVDSFREIYNDHFSLIKILVLAIISYYFYVTYSGPQNDVNGLLLHFWLILFILFGFLIEITNNVINENDQILGTLNPIVLGYDSIKGIVAISPYSAISCFLAIYCCSLIHTIQWVDVILKTIIWIIAVSIIIICFLTYASNKKILEAYNLKTIFEKAGDVIIMLIIFLIQLTVINIALSGLLGYAVFIIFGYGVIFDLFISIISIFNLGIIGHYLGQMHYELFGHEKKITP